MNTLPPASIPSTAASSQALSASSGSSSSNSTDSTSANGSSAKTSASDNFHQVLNQQIAQNNSASNGGKTSTAPVAPPTGSAASSKSSKSGHSAITQTASPASASPASDLAAQQSAAIGAAAAQSAQAAQSADATDATNLPDQAAAAGALANGASPSGQQSQAALGGNAAIAGESDAEDPLSASDSGQLAGTSDSSGSPIASRGYSAMGGGNQQSMLTSMGGKGDSDERDLSDDSGGTAAGQGYTTASDYLMAERSATTSVQSLFSDTSDKTHAASELTTAAVGDATLAAAQASTIQLPAATQSSAGPTVASASVPYQMGSDAWRADVSSHVLYFSQQDISSAQLHLNPAHLSPLNISISVDNNQTSIAFNAAHEATRQAMQDSLPQLREMFNAHGIALGQTTVGDSSAGSAQQQNQGRAQSGSGTASLAVKALESSSTAVDGISGVRVRSLQIVDTFA